MSLVKNEPLSTKIKNEPSLPVMLVSAIIGVVVAFGIDLTPDQTEAILILVAVAAPLVMRFFAFGPVSYRKATEAADIDLHDQSIEEDDVILPENIREEEEPYTHPSRSQHARRV